MKLIFLFILFLLSFEGLCQNNLQFNKVVTYASSNGCNAVYASPIYQVPSGKVWKIEKYVSTISYASVGQDGLKNSVLINNQTEISPSDFNTGNPIWLSSGNTMQVKIEGAYVCSSHFFSIIEYNVIL